MSRATIYPLETILFAHCSPTVEHQWVSKDLKESEFPNKPTAHHFTEPQTPIAIFTAYFSDDVIEYMVRMRIISMHSVTRVSMASQLMLQRCVCFWQCYCYLAIQYCLVGICTGKTLMTYSARLCLVLCREIDLKKLNCVSLGRQSSSHSL